MRILLSNDDGIFAPGLMSLYAVLPETAEVEVVAPESVQSGGSHAITIRHPVLWRTVSVADVFQGTSVEGTPADCVKLALNALLPERPDLVVSGINAGLNTGIHVLYSGTVAAAIEAAIQGCPAVAVSLELHRDMDFDAAARIAGRLIDRILESGLQPGQVFNINIPELKPGWPKGVRIEPQSIQSMAERIERRADPNGREYYWLDGDFKDIGGESQTDRHALSAGYVCVTPLQFDLTDTARLDRLREWSWPDLR
ncbi:MAG: 5'/3'-nucleotidase SurE [Phycisphaerae bacterium]